MIRIGWVLIVLGLAPGLANAWWNEEWSYKKKISIDAQKLKQDNLTTPEGAFALIRLHTGNFLSFAELADKGKDFRVLAGDEKTPLKFYLEKYDAANEMAFLWVGLTKEVVNAPEPSVWLYFGNVQAVGGEDVAGSYPVNQVLSYQFNNKSVKDATANANNPTESSNTYAEGGLIADAALFQGGQAIKVPATPSLLMSPANGWTLSTWLKLEQPQVDSVLFQRTGSIGEITLAVKDLNPVLHVADANGEKHDLTSQKSLTAGAWHQVSVVASVDNLVLYVDGEPAGTLSVKLPELTGDMTIGTDTSGGRGFVGMLDQFGLYKIGRDANAIKFDVMMQGAGSALLTYDDDQTPDSEEGGESYFMATLNNVTVDGWVIIGILAVMFIVSLLVMVLKTILINRTHSGNKKFEDAFSQLRFVNHDGNTDRPQETSPYDPALLSLTQHQNDFDGSSIYKIYDTGVKEITKRIDLKSTSGAENKLTSSALAAIKASMDAVLIRELQKLNSQMVLLTIAISGGPFLGLLGTVVGVMITFAAIAVNGEVNVNSIAPGIAAALTATVAGLAVAIPALFGYNYIGSRIKVVAADMQVFVDEFVAKLAEQFS